MLVLKESVACWPPSRTLSLYSIIHRGPETVKVQVVYLCNLNLHSYAKLFVQDRMRNVLKLLPHLRNGSLGSFTTIEVYVHPLLVIGRNR